ncbi:hypothetical protein IT407_01240 [Candidatus Uhrbacteria bacterium]|nr:hypothetical protein [Candidatus Uhrbacteria bacterium]
MKNLSLLLLTAVAAIGCAGPVEPASVEEALVTYTVTFDVGDIETNTVRIMLCDTATGMCEIGEPEGCRFIDDAPVSGHACDISVPDGDMLAFNIQLDNGFVCELDDDECARLGSVHVFRDGAPVPLERDIHGEFCNFLVMPDAIAIPHAAAPEGI